MKIVYTLSQQVIYYMNMFLSRRSRNWSHMYISTVRIQHWRRPGCKKCLEAWWLVEKLYNWKTRGEKVIIKDVPPCTSFL